MSMAAMAQAASAGVSEEFDLDIVERRITEERFRRELQVSLVVPNLEIRVGVEAAAKRIDVVLRGVKGHVRFRASIEELRRRLEQARAGSAGL